MAPGVLASRRRRADGALATTIRLDPLVRERAVAYLARHGGTLSAAVNYALRLLLKIVRSRGTARRRGEVSS